MGSDDTNQPEPAPTYGEWLVGVTFNPSGNVLVDEVKHRAAKLIDLIDKAGGDERTKAIAIKSIEEGAMWAVKSITKQPR